MDDEGHTERETGPATYAGRRVDCSHCAGRGWGQRRGRASFFGTETRVSTHPCEVCDGRGWLPEEEHAHVGLRTFVPEDAD